MQCLSGFFMLANVVGKMYPVLNRVSLDNIADGAKLIIGKVGGGGAIILGDSMHF